MYIIDGVEATDGIVNVALSEFDTQTYQLALLRRSFVVCIIVLIIVIIVVIVAKIRFVI